MKSLFRNLKHGFGLKDAWQQSRQALMRWVTVLAVGYAIPQMLAFTNSARLASLAQPAPWRAPGTRTAGLIQAGIARIFTRGRAVGLHRGDLGKNRSPRHQAQADRQRRSPTKPRKPPNAAIIVPVHRGA